jgi:glycerophosphoryl diester phosphodiesterase
VGAFLSGLEVGADYIECDVQFSQDLVPVCLHDYWLGRVTDISERPG